MVDTLADLTSALQSYVVAPLNGFGLGGYVFDLQGEGMAQLHADITDHYTEDNKALQDHIAIRPKRITLKGYVGELLYSAPGATNDGALQRATQKLTTISAFLPALSIGATQIADTIQNPSQSTLTLSSAANIYGLVKNIIGQFSNSNTSRQQSAYQYFAACQAEAILMGIQTPWEFLTNMAVETIVAIQGEESIFITDFAVTFKQIRIAATETADTLLSGTGGIVPPGGPIAQGAASTQAQLPTNNGIVPGVAPSTGVLPGAQGNLTNGSSLKTQVLNVFEYP